MTDKREAVGGRGKQRPAEDEKKKKSEAVKQQAAVPVK
jgi:hypothetical protein